MENFLKLFKDWSIGVLSVRIHALVFTCINLVLFFINLTTGMRYPWFLWPFGGLGMGLGIHYGVMFALNNSKDGRIRGLLIHGLTVLFIILPLFLFNLLTGIFYLWVFWPFIVLSLAFGIHAAVIYAIMKYKRPATRGLLIHLSVDGLLVIFYFLVNLATLPTIWFHYIAIPLILAGLEHYGVYRLITPRNQGEQSPFMQMVNQKKDELTEQNPTRSISTNMVKELLINKFGLYIHASYYLAITIFLFFVNLAGNLLSYPWFLWILLSWGFLLLYNFRSFKTIQLKVLRRKPSYLLMIPELVVGPLYFLFIYLMSNNSYPWFWWTILGYVSLTILSYFIVFSTISYQKSRSPLKSGSRSKIPSSNPRRRFCPECGSLMGPDHIFCENCGFKSSN